MWIDLRSDTVTQPDEAMRQVMAKAPVGDDVYGEDPTVNKLEALSADIMGKEAALFVPSGTMGNQLAILTHCRRGDEILCEAKSHIFYYECGGAAVLAGVQPHCIPTERGLLSVEQLEENWRGSNIHFPPTKLICVENTHNLYGGTVYAQETLKSIKKWATEKSVPIHMDGARVFNAAVANQIPVGEIAQHVDTLMFCISKGLGAPIGSLLVGPKDWIQEARRWRKMLGGGMRQAGIVAAAGIVALNERVKRLAEDHHLARSISEELVKLGYELPFGLPETNIFMVKKPANLIDENDFAQKLKEQNILVNPFGKDTIRLVTHCNVSISQLPEIVKVFKELQEV